VAFVTVIQEHFWGFLKATGMTLQLTAVSLVLAVVIGLIFAFLKLSNNRVANLVANGYIGLTRGLPLIVQLMFLYFGISEIILLSSFWAGSLALALSAGTGRRKLAIWGAVGAALMLHVYNSVSMIGDALAGWEWVSPFHFYIGNDPLANGMDWSHAAVLAAISVVLIGAAFVLFPRRDLRQGGE